jgi:hypothetical protein
MLMSFATNPPAASGLKEVMCSHTKFQPRLLTTFGDHERGLGWQGSLKRETEL